MTDLLVCFDHSLTQFLAKTFFSASTRISQLIDLRLAVHRFNFSDSFIRYTSIILSMPLQCFTVTLECEGTSICPQLFSRWLLIPSLLYGLVYKTHFVGDFALIFFTCLLEVFLTFAVFLNFLNLGGVIWFPVYLGCYLALV